VRRNDPKYTVKVAALPKSAGVTVGKPGKVIRTAMRAKVAFPLSGSTQMGAGGNFYSPELSPDFLELPQSVDEQRNYYRFFYDHDPFVGQAIDLHSELPLSKLRLRKPRAKNKELAEASMRFCERWVKKIGLLHRLLEIVHDFYLVGEVFVFAEDTAPDMPKEVTHQPLKEVTPEGKIIDEWQERDDAREKSVEWLKANYAGWTGLRVLPPEQIHMESFPFTDKRIIELIPDSKTKSLVERARQGDTQAAEIVNSYPGDIIEHVLAGVNIPLNTNPMAGSFVHYLARKKSSYEPRGKSILQRCLRVLVYRDKLRQAQTSIASRHMTPIRVVWAEDMNAEQTEELREQVDLALQDPDFSIIANFQVNWEEMGGGQGNRLLELTSEYDLTDRQLYAGLGVTESLLSGESSYSGDRIHLEVINVRYLLLREVLQDFVDNHLLEPMCRRMGFVETDEDGHEVVITPRLSFTRLALRDNQETFDALFNLYTKGSLDIDTILDLLNIDPDTVTEKLERDFGTFNDATFNELLRSLYSRAGDQIVENSDFVEKMAEQVGANYNKPKEEGMSRFAAAENPVAMLKAAVKSAMDDHWTHDRPIHDSSVVDDRIASLEAQIAELQTKLPG
tara:strand:+ start:27843 stop:29702 length:1860 start_codon:yes stop_codon:yes gene_type:complete